MFDEGIIQIMYNFENNSLTDHRLAYFPSPDLEMYQLAKEIYDGDFLYGNIISRSINPFLFLVILSMNIRLFFQPYIRLKICVMMVLLFII